ncbi:MAG: YfaZ family outer membrane protein [Stenotrophobium sp.]
MKTALAGLGFALAVASFPSHAEILDLNISSNAVRGDFSGPISRVLPGTVGQYDFGVISRPHNSNNLFEAHGGLLLTGDAGLNGVDLAAGLGGRLLYIGLDHNHGGAFALGGQAEARLPSYNRLGLSGYSYFAPSVTSFSDINRYWENGIAVDYEVIHGGNVYLGYRNLRLDVRNGGSISADNGFNVGFRLKF